MDFVVGLPKTRGGMDSVYVVVDRFSKISYCVPCKSTSDATHIASLFFKKIMRIHGLPISMMLDRDTKFMSHFLKPLG